MSFRICHIRGVYQQSIKHLFITKPPEQGIIIMDSCSSGPQHKTFSQTRWICTWCIGFSTIPNASVNFPVGPVLTTRFTPRRRTTILAFVTSESKTPYRGKFTPCTLNIFDPRKRPCNVELCNAQLSMSIRCCLSFTLMGLWGSLVVRKRASVVSAFQFWVD